MLQLKSLGCLNFEIVRSALFLTGVSQVWWAALSCKEYAKALFDMKIFRPELDTRKHEQGKTRARVVGNTQTCWQGHRMSSISQWAENQISNPQRAIEIKSIIGTETGSLATHSYKVHASIKNFPKESFAKRVCRGVRRWSNRLMHCLKQPTIADVCTIPLNCLQFKKSLIKY